jgi:hypothetical protein
MSHATLILIGCTEIDSDDGNGEVSRGGHATTMLFASKSYSGSVQEGKSSLPARKSAVSRFQVRERERERERERV